MVTILIPTYYYKPCNFTPVNRIHSWIEYFSKMNCYVIIVTRQWQVNLNEYQKSGTDIVVEKFSNYEIHYLPYRGNLRTSFKKSFFRKGLTFLEQVFQNKFHNILPFHNIITYSLQCIPQFKPKIILISGGPFQLFKIGYLANKKFQTEWIADYRDGWTVGNFDKNIKQLPYLLINLINNFAEKKWLKTSNKFTTVSSDLKNKISKQINKSGIEIYNGYVGVLNEDKMIWPLKTILNVIYSGEIYKQQDYIGLISVIKKIIDNLGSNSIKLTFLGTDESNHKIDSSRIINYEKNIFITKRLPYKEALRIQQRADVFMMLNYKGMKGIASSKIFDYLKSLKPILLFRNDFDILEELVVNSGLGIIVNNEIELYNELEKLVKIKMKGQVIQSTPNLKYIQQFSRENQAAKLLNYIKNI